ncbi:hypothetical protein HYDPIDRAFT_31623 [Hydnomerulius pinastri MD-312]|uniref:Uncharacterized protein n=1 Tax=Hydnomerulius pinastri MD-312 TaxID=994086 RepID=A0A0C9W444_9AGAM|nr:hypothetical protein HYDPIDRAFT_31623 [Hydnomerulius pinastri MD-312]
MSSGAAQLMAEYIDVARVVEITRMCQLVPYVAMVYDHLLTFDQELLLLN